MKHRCMLAVAFLSGLMILSGCGKRAENTTATSGARPAAGQQTSIEVKGSDTMVNLGQAWAEAYQKAHPDVGISVTGGGSGTGITALINGTTNIAEASREMDPKEIAEATKNGHTPKQFVVARDGVSVVVNPSNAVSKLTIAQLSDIFTGKATNWKQFGGPDLGIVVLSRDTSSGTHVFFLEHVVRRGNAKGPEQYAKTTLFLPSSQAIAQEVAGNKAAIGYVGMGYVTPGKQKTVAVAKDANAPSVEPTPQNVINNTYPVARQLYFYTPGEPTGKVKDYIDFVLSDAGQKIVAQKEFVPIRQVK